MYKVCILAAGRGTRNTYAKDSNKVLLPLGKGTVLSYQIGKFPKNTEFVIAVGYNAPMVVDYTKSLNLNITRVYAQYEGKGTGPGYSLLQCAPLLQCPFIYMACDTIVLDSILSPSMNWIGVSKVKYKPPYLTIGLKGKLVEKLYDKGDKKATYLAHIGLVGVKDYKAFWEGLAHPKKLGQNEHQDTSGLNALIEHGLHPISFQWFDTGGDDGYRRAVWYFDKKVS